MGTFLTMGSAQWVAQEPSNKPPTAIRIINQSSRSKAWDQPILSTLRKLNRFMIPLGRHCYSTSARYPSRPRPPRFGWLAVLNDFMRLLGLEDWAVKRLTGCIRSKAAHANSKKLIDPKVALWRWFRNSNNYKPASLRMYPRYPIPRERLVSRAPPYFQIAENISSSLKIPCKCLPRA